MRLPVYLDNHATTPVDPRVLEEMLPYLRDDFGNAASRNHPYGWKAEEAVNEARVLVAKLIGATAREIVFTSGATESNNLAIKGVVSAYAKKGNHVITQATEHKAVLDTLLWLQSRGHARITVLDVDGDGLLAPEAVAEAIGDDTVLCSIMLCNNEIGTVQSVAAIGEICRRAGVLFHCDAVQGVGKVDFDVESMNVGLASISAHKIYGPKGVGALYVRRRDPRVVLDAQVHGGGHERGWRSGTLNVPGIVGLGAAARCLQSDAPGENQRIRDLRDGLWRRLGDSISEITLNGHPTLRHPGNLHLSFLGVEAEPLILGCRDLALSSGAACTSAQLEPSHVMKAIGASAERTHSSIRMGLGRFTTPEEVDLAADTIIAQVKKLSVRINAR